MSKLSSVIQVKPRFSRSINIERDKQASSLEGYVPTGRALDVIKRIAQGLEEPLNGRSFSITGPHGGGKSSLAILIKALTSGTDRHEYRVALELIRESDNRLANYWNSSFGSLENSKDGFAQAFVTASREPIKTTLLRAMRGVVENLRISQSEKSRYIKSLNDGDRGIIDVVKEVAAEYGLVIVIDEFGKNIEAFADSPAEADLFVLQSLAELSAGEKALPLLILTLQHLSFDEYIQGVGSAQKKEWAKIQGRFQDIPYVESSYQSRRLIASVFKAKNPSIAKRFKAWLDANSDLLNKAGLAEFSDQVETRATFPLHPLTLSVLPQLCSKYGQNERTLFSFLASKTRNSVVEFLEEQEYSSSGELPMVGLDRVYDYFLESSTTTISTSSTANRWIEIETRIRDAQGLDRLELKLLKSIGILNLVSSGGLIRASRDVLKLAVAESTAKVHSKIDSVLDKSLAKLESKGLVVYRSFADEFRVWQGSDFDLRAAVEQTRRTLSAKPLMEVLAGIVNLPPVVAGRNSQQFGILRVFQQRIYINSDSLADSQKIYDKESFDGQVLYVLASDLVEAESRIKEIKKPTLIISAPLSTRFQDLILEAASLENLISTKSDSELDWVAKREAIERLIYAKRQVQSEIEAAWILSGNWSVPLYPKLKLIREKGISANLSALCDLHFSKTPRVPNEMIARRELTGQGAKARRAVLECMLNSSQKENLGIEGYGPDRAIYDAVLLQTGIHQQNENGEWTFSKPRKKTWIPVWNEFEKILESSVDSKVNCQLFYDRLSTTPFGLKNGIIPILLNAFLIANKDEIALYEHGTLLLELDEPTLERLVKNPWNFSLRNYFLTSTSRSAFLIELIESFGISQVKPEQGFVNVVKALYREILSLSEFARKTKVLLGQDSIQVRDLFFEATEPDKLLFFDLPKALGFDPILPAGKYDAKVAKEFAKKLKGCFIEIKSIRQKLLDQLAKEISLSTATSSQIDKMRKQLQGQAENLDGRVIDASLRAFVSAIQRTSLSDEDWLENLSMVALEGKPPKTWIDDDLQKFSLRMTEIGGALNRLQALLYDRLSKHEDGFDAVRLTLTRPDGSETAKVLSISDSERLILEAASENILSELQDTFDGEDEAKTILLAFLATKLGKQEANLSPERKRKVR